MQTPTTASATVQPAAVLGGIEGELAEHPYASGLVIALLFAAFLGLAKTLLSRMEQRINEKFAQQDKRDDDQDGRLDRIEKDLGEYDKHVALGAQEAVEIHASVKRVEVALGNHVEKEENITWTKIDALVEAVNEMRLQNEVSHAQLTGRLNAVESKMPNGELKKLADAYHALAQRDVAEAARRATKRR